MPRKGNALVNLALNLLLHRYGLDKGKNQEGLPELADIPSIQALRKKAGAVILIVGGREFGKTIMSRRLAEIIGRPTYAVSPQEKPPEWIKELTLQELDEQPPPYSTLLLDDLPTYMSMRDYGTAYVQQVERIIPVVRHKRKLILVFIAQTSGQADKWCMDADLVLLKAPSMLYEDVERSSVKKWQDKAMQYWEGKSDHWLQRHAYVISRREELLARVAYPLMDSRSTSVTK